MTDLSSSSGLLEACWRFVVLGVLQGLTEFLPISSTAHLKAIPVLMGWGDPGVSVTAVLQLGSIVAVIAYFWRDLAGVLKGIAQAFRRGNWRGSDARLGLAIALGTVPIVIAGMAIRLFWQGYEESPLRSIPSIALVSIVMAALLALAEWIGPRWKQLPAVQARDGLLVGLAQALSLIPGVSRSGSTLTAALLDGWRHEDAARFSFLLGIPAITLAGLLEVKSAFAVPTAVGILPLLLGIISAAAVSWLAIDWLLNYLQRHSTWIFVIYRLLFGTVLLFWCLGTAANGV